MNWISCLIIFVCIVLLLVGCQGALRREIASAERDVLTGIVVGTEARTLCPVSENDKQTAVLMIHGFCSSRQDFNDLGERLCRQGFTVRQMRLPGHGTTPAEFAWQDMDALYQAANAELKALQKEFSKVVLVGFSTGGALSTILASENQVDGLILLSPLFRVTYKFYYGFPPEWYCKALHWLVPYLCPIRSNPFVNKKESRGKFFCYRVIPNRGVLQIIKLEERASEQELLTKIKAPILWCHAPEDEVTSFKHAEKAVEQMGSTIKKCYRAEQSNHIILWDYDSEEVMGQIEQFLKEIGL